MKFEPASNMLLESTSGDYLLIEKVRGSAMPIVIPKSSTLNSKQDYYNTYYELFNCDNPAAGEVIILSPAVVEKSASGWQLREAGFIDIKPDQNSQVTTVLTQETVRCGTCGTVGSLGHDFCNACGSPLGQRSAKQPAIQDTDIPDAERQNAQAATESYAATTGAYSDNLLPNEIAPSTVTAASASPSRLKLIVGVVVVVGLLGIAITIISSLSDRGNSVDKQLDNAIARGNLFAPANGNARDLYYELKNTGAGEETLNRYREKLTPLLTRHGYQLTSSLMQIGYDEPDFSEWQEAAKSLDWAVELNPGNSHIAARAAYCKGRAAYLQKQLDQALKSWSLAADLDKSWVLPANGLGMVHTGKRNWGSARSYFFQALKRDANWPFPEENIGNTYREEKDYATAKEFYNKALGKAPNWAKPHVHLANIAMVEQDYATAVSEFEAALSPNASGLKGNEPANVQKALDKARRKLSEIQGY